MKNLLRKMNSICKGNIDKFSVRGRMFSNLGGIIAIILLLVITIIPNVELHEAKKIAQKHLDTDVKKVYLYQPDAGHCIHLDEQGHWFESPDRRDGALVLEGGTWVVTVSNQGQLNAYDLFSKRFEGDAERIYRLSCGNIWNNKWIFYVLILIISCAVIAFMIRYTDDFDEINPNELKKIDGLFYRLLKK